MPCHIYIRIRRYHDAVVANREAIAVDNNYIAQNSAKGIYSIAYMPHYHHFLWFAAMMEGNSKLATAAGNNVAAMFDLQMLPEPGMGTLMLYSY